jgi:C1A family cysteine protease
MAAFYSSCGAKLQSATAHFCAECGAKVKGATAAAGGVAVAKKVLGVVGALAGELLERRAFERITHPRGHSVVVGACKKDEHDPNDRHYDVHQNVDPGNLPAFVDLREWMTPVEDQGDLGSCTANAIAGAYEYLEKRITGREGDVSRLFIYYLERKMEGNENQDSGAQLRNGMKVLKSYGACSERTWPYDVDRFTDEPHEHAFSEAESHLVDEYQRVPVDLHAMKTCIAEGYPFVFGTKIYKQFEKDGNHGRISMPSGSDLGGHAMLACGYSDQDQVFVVRNSWGADWGDAGYCYIPYDYLADSDQTHDCWTLRRAHNLDFSASAEPGGSSHASGRMSFFEEVVSLVDQAAGIDVPENIDASDQGSDDQEENDDTDDESDNEENDDDDENDEEE